MMSVHQQYDLKQMQSLPLHAKIMMSQQRIKAWYEHWNGQVYVSVSGGKDSTVLAHIVKSMYPDVPCVFVNTGLEYTSVADNAKEISDEIIRPKMSFKDVITKYGYPIVSKEQAQFLYELRTTESGKLRDIRINGNKWGRGKVSKKWMFLADAPFMVSHHCCNVMKKAPAHKYEKGTESKVYLGTMAEESQLRRQKWMRNGCNAFNASRPTSQPLSFWTDNDILEYIREYNLKIPEIYGEITGDNDNLSLTGADRTGCTFCMFGISRDTDRFLRLKEAEPQKYDYIMRGGGYDARGLWVPAPDENGRMGLGYKFVINWLNKHGDLDIKY